MAKGKRKAAVPPHKPGTAHTATPDWLIVGLAAFGMLLTAYLTGVAWFADSPAFCAEGSGCDLIQQSRWSTLFGLPLALWGFATYAVIALMAWRMPAQLKRWRRLWYVALIGLAISLYLTAIGIFALNAICLWCLASLLTISALFIAVAVRRPASAPGMAWPKWVAQSAGTALIVVATLHLWYSEVLIRPDSPQLEALAVHLEQSGAKYYGAWWCPSCQEQKRHFRGSADRLPFVECSTGGRGSSMTLRCRDLGIEAYPTWVIGGRHYQGMMTPRELSLHSGFNWVE